MKESLKALLANILSELTSTSVPITISYKNSPGEAMKCGKVVSFQTAADWISLPTGGFRTVATLPSGWGPPQIIYVAEATKSNTYIRINPDGTIQTYNSNSSVASAMNGRYAACWVVE